MTVSNLPIDQTQIMRLALKRIEAGASVEDAVTDVMPRGAWDRLPPHERDELFKVGIFSRLQEAIITFVDANKEALVDHIEATAPKELRFLEPVLRSRFETRDLFRAIRELEIEP
ncbi:hypothetical protein [Jiella sonneratiae]|uniref:Uncharacterized protein n=1 Tax=Jiella sonneratiae TaxID=2816856 RepID=A0ABS3J8Y2_9HYPH|nr:hypothetical protein [Jiella sonneratiae]MBO0905572.1 hypothetical protein [Jiella sonneratiae]